MKLHELMAAAALALLLSGGPALAHGSSSHTPPYLVVIVPFGRHGQVRVHSGGCCGSYGFPHRGYQGFRHGGYLYLYPGYPHQGYPRYGYPYRGLPSYPYPYQARGCRR